MKKVQFYGQDLELKKAKYIANDSLALVLVDQMGQLFSKVTVNVDNVQMPNENTAVVKDYSENEGILSVLKESGVEFKIVGSVRMPFNSCPLVEFNLDGVDEI